MALIDLVLEFVKGEIIKELKAQGHNNRGNLVDSIEILSQQLADDVVGQIKMNRYWEALNTGVRASRIPYRQGSGAKTSKYIDALVDYFESKGLATENARGAAFATARKHKKEGMPTLASYRFSKNGRRKGFLNEVVKSNAKYIGQYIELEHAMELELIMDQMIDRVNAA